MLTNVPDRVYVSPVDLTVCRKRAEKKNVPLANKSTYTLGTKPARIARKIISDRSKREKERGKGRKRWLAVYQANSLYSLYGAQCDVIERRDCLNPRVYCTLSSVHCTRNVYSRIYAWVNSHTRQWHLHSLPHYTLAFYSKGTWLRGYTTRWRHSGGKAGSVNYFFYIYVAIYIYIVILKFA